MNKWRLRFELLLILFLLILASPKAWSAITDGKFSANQIFDVQYYWSGNTLYASNFIAPYDKNFQTVTVSTGQYFQFFPSTTQPGKYGLGLYNSNGSLAKVVHDHGDITALGDGAIFYIGSGFFGNVISTAQGYTYGDSGVFANMDTSVTSTDLNNYTWASTTPLADGQTAQPTTPPPPTYGVNFTRITSYEWKNYTAGSQPISAEQAHEAFDNNDSKWFGFRSQGAWVVVQLVTNGSYAPTRAVQKIQFKTANDAPERDPNGYRIWGSADGVNWVLIKEEAIALPAGRNAESVIYDLNNKIAYSYYKVEFTGTKTGGDAFQINEIRLLYDVDDPQGELAGGGIYVPPTPVYSSGITTTQSARRAANLSETTGHQANVTIQGNDNEITIQQIGGGHFVSVDVNGNTNSLDILQTTTSGARHYMEVGVIGNNNNLILQQRETSKNMFVGVDGSNNNLNVEQKGTGNHFLDIQLLGDNHNAGIIQNGSGNHAATVRLENGGGAWNFQLNQDGATAKTYSLPHGLSDGGTVNGVCNAPSGCNLIVNQQ